VKLDLELLPRFLELVSWTALGFTALVVAAAWALTRALAWLAQRAAAAYPGRRAGLLGLVPLARVLVWAFALVVIVRAVLQPSPTMETALLAAVLIALGIAGQDELKNLVGGLVVLARRPFGLGDVVHVGDYYGEVIAIRPTCTVLRTFDDSLVTLPNAKWLSSPVSSVNAGELDALVAVTFAVPADRDPYRLSDLCRQAALSSPYVRLDRPVSVKLGFLLGERIATKVTIKAYVYDVRLEPKMESDVLARALRAVQQAGLMPKVSEYEF
jgi:small-conductance mechanosensitive channel